MRSSRLDRDRRHNLRQAGGAEGRVPDVVEVVVARHAISGHVLVDAPMEMHVVTHMVNPPCPLRDPLAEHKKQLHPSQNRDVVLVPLAAVTQTQDRAALAL